MRMLNLDLFLFEFLKNKRKWQNTVKKISIVLNGKNIFTIIIEGENIL